MRKGSARSERTKGTLFRALAANATATALKAAVFMGTGSSAMFAEAIHSFVDTANQAVLNRGQIEASFAPDSRHQYGYGKAQYVWGLVSAMGIMWMGAGVAVYRGFEAIIHPPETLFVVPNEAWAALAASLLLDGYVLVGATKELASRAAAESPEDFLTVAELAGRVVDDDGKVTHMAAPSMLSLALAAPTALRRRVGAVLNHVRKTRDTSVAAVFLEDVAGCAGVAIATGGLLATQITGDVIWDGVATLSIGGLLAAVAVQLVDRNRRLLLGEAVDPDMAASITALVASRPAIEGVREVQSQWITPETFAYKAEVDFDGTVLAAGLLQDYSDLFLGARDLETELPVLLSLFAEDVTRAVELELKDTEALIREHYPGAAFIELEPDSLAANERMSSVASSVEGRRGERRQLLASLLANIQTRAVARRRSKHALRRRSGSKGASGPGVAGGAALQHSTSAAKAGAVGASDHGGDVEAAEEEARLREWFLKAELLGAGRSLDEEVSAAVAVAAAEPVTHGDTEALGLAAATSALSPTTVESFREQWDRTKSELGEAGLLELAAESARDVTSQENAEAVSTDARAAGGKRRRSGKGWTMISSQEVDTMRRALADFRKAQTASKQHSSAAEQEKAR